MLKTNQSQSSGTRKPGPQRDRNGQNYETAVEYIFKHFLEKNYPHIQIETLSNIKLEAKHFSEHFKELRRNLDNTPWVNFIDNATKDFDNMEIDLIVKMSLKSKEESTGMNQNIVFMPYDLKNDELGYSINLENCPQIIYFQLTNYPHQFHKKLWQTERNITLHNLLEDKIKNNHEILVPDMKIQTEIATKIETWKQWLILRPTASYAIVSNNDHKVWLERFVSKLCLFHEQPTLDNDIIFKPNLEGDLLKLLVNNQIKDLVDHYKNNEYIKTNSLKHTKVGQILQKGKMLFFFTEASFDVILNQISNFHKYYMEEINKIKESFKKEIQDQKNKINELVGRMTELKKQMGMIKDKEE